LQSYVRSAALRRSRSGSNLASYLLFEEGYCRALIDLGYQDTMSRADEVRGFFEDD